MKINPADQIESVDIVLTEAKTPIAYNNKIQELVEEGCYGTVEEAKADNPRFVLECEIYYEKGNGVFLVESDAINCSCEIYSPYTQEILETD